MAPHSKWSASSLAVAKAGCPAAMAEYDKPRDGRVDIPDFRRDRGTAFHRIAEGVQTAVQQGHDAETALSAAIEEAAASAELAAMLRAWHDAGWTSTDGLVGVEVAIAIDAYGMLVPFDSPLARLRGILDRVEVTDVWDESDEEAEPQKMLVITDWKTGWKRWTGLQDSIYAVLADAYATAKGLEVYSIRVRIWSPTAKPAMIWEDVTRDDDTISGLWSTIEQEMEAGDRLRRADNALERPSGYCGWCPRKAVCGAFTAITDATGWQPLTTPQLAEDAARRLAAIESARKELIAEIKAYFDETGEPVSDGVAVWGLHPVVKKQLNSEAIYKRAMARLAPDIEPEAIKNLAALLPVGMEAANKFAQKLSPGTKAGQDEIKATWTKETPGVEYKRAVLKETE